MSRPQSRITWIVALAVIAALVALGLLSSGPSEADSVDEIRAPLPVTVIEAQLEPGYDVLRSYVGRVEARRSSQLGFERGGLLMRVRVEEADVVDRGEVLAQLDTDRLEAQKRTLEAQLEQARADATLAELTLERVGEAQQLDAVTPQQLDEAKLGLAARQAALAGVEAALEEIEVEIRKSRLVAPFDGVVSNRFADEGQVLGAGAPVLGLLESGRPQARIGIAGDAVAKIVAGQSHVVTVGERRLGATVIAVLPVRRAGTRSVEVLLELDAELTGADRVHEGDLARLELRSPLEASGFWLPTSALTESSRGLWAVYAVTADDAGDATAERRELEVLHQEADRVFARGTLQDGERIIASGLQRLMPGQRVEVRERASQKQASQDQAIQKRARQDGASEDPS